MATNTPPSTTSSRRGLGPLGPALLLAIGLGASACVGLPSSGDDAQEAPVVATEPAADAPSEDPCAIVGPEATIRVGSALTEVLPGAALTGVNGPGCVQRYTAGADWIELRFEPATGDGDGLFPVTDELSTNGLDTTRVQLADGAVDVTAAASDPAGISTWDASLAGAGALLDP